MAQFMLILTERPDEYKNYSPEQLQALLEKYMAWTQRIAAGGNLVGGHKLMEEGGKLVSRKGDRVITTDGPYAEAKEVVGGYFIIRAADYGEAAQIASTCPAADFGAIT